MVAVVVMVTGVPATPDVGELEALAAVHAAEASTVYEVSAYACLGCNEP